MGNLGLMVRKVQNSDVWYAMHARDISEGKNINIFTEINSVLERIVPEEEQKEIMKWLWVYSDMCDIQNSHRRDHNNNFYSFQLELQECNGMPEIWFCIDENSFVISNLSTSKKYYENMMIPQWGIRKILSRLE
jgi:hypothetical protein